MKKINNCRACGSSALTPAFSLDGMINAQRAGRKPRPLDFVLCDATKDAFACGLLQSGKIERRALIEETPSAAYRSTRSHLRSIATEALEIVSGRDCSALDIGCNDGTLLSFYPRWVDRYGVDTNDIVENVGGWAWTAKAPFPSAELDKAFGEKSFDIITAVSVLEKIEEPRAFFARMKSLLASDGVIVIETLYAAMALARTGVDAFASGAQSVYSLGVLERIARDCDLKIFRGALTDKEGGSIRLYLTHANVTEYDFDPWFERLARLWDEENALALREIQSYQAFENRAEAARDEFTSMLADIEARGETVHLLSAGPQAVALFRWAGEYGRVITAAIDEQPSEGAYLCDHGPIVISETDCRAAEPDYVIAPAPLKREMLERWREAIVLGAKMIVASPTPHIIDANNYSSEFGKALAGGDNPGEVETLRAILTAAGGPRLIAVGGTAAKAASS